MVDSPLRVIIPRRDSRGRWGAKRLSFVTPSYVSRPLGREATLFRHPVLRFEAVGARSDSLSSSRPPFRGRWDVTRVSRPSARPSSSARRRDARVRAAAGVAVARALSARGGGRVRMMPFSTTERGVVTPMLGDRTSDRRLPAPPLPRTGDARRKRGLVKPRARERDVRAARCEVRRVTVRHGGGVGVVAATCMPPTPPADDVIDPPALRSLLGAPPPPPPPPSSLSSNGLIAK